MKILKLKTPEPMTEAERKAWRSKWIGRLVEAGVPLFQLAGKTDYEIWQMKNKQFGEAETMHRRLPWSPHNPNRKAGGMSVKSSPQSDGR